MPCCLVRRSLVFQPRSNEGYADSLICTQSSRPSEPCITSLNELIEIEKPSELFSTDLLCLSPAPSSLAFSSPASIADFRHQCSSTEPSSLAFSGLANIANLSHQRSSVRPSSPAFSGAFVVGLLRCLCCWPSSAFVISLLSSGLRHQLSLARPSL
jgi:hypothetical protein